ncbi:hypothetical protein PU629_07935 [Pullulanibacillus sp. KACC 23026]|uniref:hypothetical protein n=1 Tax=Pullulanibacillus sp. KACC 23026 TaxID=3028315 RepID=UPI0023AE7E1A|nr:hypothetical protein [Pullulanibacillus sp. KACC 23026]WEG14277.1 hypothetical protein PU629_07935 [Pullulanibacillus sp. KACC 23026]
MDLYFLRMDTGYDAVMLAVKDEEGSYNVYRVDEQEEEEQALCLFKETDPDQLRDHVRKWCQSHLPEELKMVEIPVIGGIQSVEKLKRFLEQQAIPYERRQQTFYVSRRVFDRVTQILDSDEIGECGA